MLTAEEIIRAFWYAQFRGIKMRWNPALVAKLAKLEPPRWQEEPRWLRMMPMLITWHVIDDLPGKRADRLRDVCHYQALEDARRV